MFDHTLILAPGGRTVYFGKTGEPLNNYFARNGAVMSESANPAEFVITTISSSEKENSRGADLVQLWQTSPECRELNNYVVQHMSGKKPIMATAAAGDKNGENATNKAYALPLTAQVMHLTKRQWISVWRNGPYNFSKLFKSIFFEMLLAFTFFKAGPDANGLQNHALAILLATWVVPTIAHDIQQVWFEKWSIFVARERNGIYDFKALLMALIIVETPWQILNFTLVFLCSYWTVGFPNISSAVGFVYFIYLLLSLFATGFCFLMATMFPNPTMAGYANSLFWVVFVMFGGIVTPRQVLNDFYRPWIFCADPLRYYFGASVSTVLHDVTAVCKDVDLATFDPPPGTTCGEYTANYN